MGSALNPRFFGGRVDIKMFAEIRSSWLLLFLLSLSAALKEYDLTGTVSPGMIVIVVAHFLYSNACFKGEHCIPTTWDMFEERFGWMLCFWNLAGVPFVYTFNAYFLIAADRATSGVSAQTASVLLCVLFIAYYIWDESNAQRNYFRSMRDGNEPVRRWAPPQLPNQCLQNPRVLKTDRGELLVDGWWRWVRKPHYTSDICMAFIWALGTGFQHALPYVYPFFFLSVLIHRVMRDEARCRKKYGRWWDEYIRIVPHAWIPGLC
eukprot:TRINITY_DN56102_c0_g1_i1.p1 TRINITY_DN56102_c0_g1~~TRINITY_DN56102_c0_g1_i1.p1  ORF type:complete len:302 (+),score=75.19 TRINITY_DN56102_c0_g1_i1:118-906(+)